MDQTTRCRLAQRVTPVQFVGRSPSRRVHLAASAGTRLRGLARLHASSQGVLVSSDGQSDDPLVSGLRAHAPYAERPRPRHRTLRGRPLVSTTHLAQLAASARTPPRAEAGRTATYGARTCCSLLTCRFTASQEVGASRRRGRARVAPRPRGTGAFAERASVPADSRRVSALAAGDAMSPPTRQ
jgi:hypothetical protein